MKYSQIFQQTYGTDKPFSSSLSDLESQCLSELTFYPEDVDVKIKLPISGFDKCLAIAIYDWHTGAIKDFDFVHQLAAQNCFKSLFNCNLDMLF
jgi:hypothetical protein